MIRRLSLGLVLLVAVTALRADEAEDRAVRANEKLGGEITTPGKPVTGVDLSLTSIKDSEMGTSWQSSNS
jgi:hypothetical protein